MGKLLRAWYLDAEIDADVLDRDSLSDARVDAYYRNRMRTTLKSRGQYCVDDQAEKSKPHDPTVRSRLWLEVTMQMRGKEERELLRAIGSPARERSSAKEEKRVEPRENCPLCFLDDVRAFVEGPERETEKGKWGRGEWRSERIDRGCVC